MNLAQHALKECGLIKSAPARRRASPSKYAMLNNKAAIKQYADAGLTSAQIAEKLGIGRNTFATHMKDVLPEATAELIAYNGRRNSSLAVSKSNARRNKAKIQAVQ